jgi:hypothetical protein
VGPLATRSPRRAIRACRQGPPCAWQPPAPCALRRVSSSRTASGSSHAGPMHPAVSTPWRINGDKDECPGGGGSLPSASRASRSWRKRLGHGALIEHPWRAALASAYGHAAVDAQRHRAAPATRTLACMPVQRRGRRFVLKSTGLRVSSCSACIAFTVVVWTCGTLQSPGWSRGHVHCP